MSFTWPLALLLAAAVPILLGISVWNARRRRKRAVRYSSVSLLKSAMPRGPRWRRHVPLALLLAALGTLALASGRPQVTRQVSIGRTSIILALDVSQSMCATDVDPNRLSVAQAAARSFVEDQAKGTRIGLVVFSGFAQLAVPPTTERQALIDAIDGLTTARGTAIGSAMLKSLDAVAEVNADVPMVGNSSLGTPPTAEDVGKAGAAGFVPDIVVLLTDGANTRGIKPLDAVPYAIERRVRVYTIGFGTTQPAAMVCTRQQLGGNGFGDFDGGGFGGGGFGGGGGGGFRGGGGAGSPLVVDEPTLQQVAEQTGGTYYRAEDTEQLKNVFAELPRDVETQQEEQEISAVFAALGALLAGAAVLASIRWSPYP